MATMTTEEIRTLRLYTDIPAGSDQFLDDSDLQVFFDAADGDVNRAAAEIWKVKAARVNEWYTVNMDGNFMTRGEVFEHCLKMSTLYASGGSMTNVALLTRDPVSESSEF